MPLTGLSICRTLPIKIVQPSITDVASRFPTSYCDRPDSWNVSRSIWPFGREVGNESMEKLELASISDTVIRVSVIVFFVQSRSTRQGVCENLCSLANERPSTWTPAASPDWGEPFVRVLVSWAVPLPPEIVTEEPLLLHVPPPELDPVAVIVQLPLAKTT